MKLTENVRKAVQDYDENRRVLASAKLSFSGVNGKDVYNITAPINYKGSRIISGRVENRDSEEDSQTMFFIESGEDNWKKILAPVHKLQDPFWTTIDGEIVFGGVEVEREGESLVYRTQFYRGSSIYDLKPFAEGPVGMKNIRLVELPEGNIGVFTRPQGKVGGTGTIGFTRIIRLENLDSKIMINAPLLEGQFSLEEWGGANEIHVLDDSWVGVLGHVACFDGEGDKHYYPMVFKFNYHLSSVSPYKIIAKRQDLGEGESKRSDLKDVIFSGGLDSREDYDMDLYVGSGDAETHRIVIPNPFK